MRTCSTLQKLAHQSVKIKSHRNRGSQLKKFSGTTTKKVDAARDRQQTTAASGGVLTTTTMMSACHAQLAEWMSATPTAPPAGDAATITAVMVRC